MIFKAVILKCQSDILIAMFLGVVWSFVIYFGVGVVVI